MNPLRHKFLPLSFAVSIIGLIFSVYNILDSVLWEESCSITCSVFSHFAFMGFSLWWISTLVFALILIFSLFGLAYAIRVITGTALFLDLFLFVIMLNTALCLMCMGAGILFALAYYAVRFENRRPIDPYPKTVLLTVWGLVFVALVGAGINFSQKPFALILPEKATTNVFFSPSCSACKKLAAAEYSNEKIAWFPVEENEDDIWRIIFIQEQLEAGKTLHEALLNVEKEKPEASVAFVDVLDLDYLTMQYKVWKNSAMVKRRSSVLPFVEIYGAPRLLEPQITLQDSIQTNANTGNLQSLIGQETTLCGDDEKPCE